MLKNIETEAVDKKEVNNIIFLQYNHLIPGIFSLVETFLEFFF